jgi:hypothetical protein
MRGRIRRNRSARSPPASAIRDGETTRKVSLLTANLLAHAMNGAKGDARSAAFFLNQAHKFGLVDNQVSGDVRKGSPDRPRQSDALVKDLDLNLLARDEQLELSQLISVIDRDGSIWSLSASELERVRELVNKGRAADANRH